MNTGNAMGIIDRALLDMGDDPEETWDNLINIVDDQNFNPRWDEDCASDDIWDDIEEMYEIISKKKPEVIEKMLQYRIENGDLEDLYKRLPEEGAWDYSKSQICQAIDTLFGFVQEGSQVYPALARFITDVSNSYDFLTMRKVYEIAHSYWRCLKDEDVWGVRTNDHFTVGEAITETDVRDNPSYEGFDYVCHKSFNSVKFPALALTILFKTYDDGDIDVVIRLGRYGYVNERKSCVSIVEDIQLPEGFFWIPESWEKERTLLGLTNKLNDLVQDVCTMVKKHPELREIAPYRKEESK